MKVVLVKKGARRYAVVVPFVAEAEYGLDGAVFGDLATGGNARLFQSFDQEALQVGGSPTLEWSRPEGRRRHPPRKRRRPATARPVSS